MYVYIWNIHAPTLHTCMYNPELINSMWLLLNYSSIHSAGNNFSDLERRVSFQICILGGQTWITNVAEYMSKNLLIYSILI